MCRTIGIGAVSGIAQSRHVGRRPMHTANGSGWPRGGNQNYFRSPDNSDRVKAWRREHPGYWRKKKPAGGVALQDPCSAQKTERESVTTPCVPPALQEDIARSARSVLARGLDILDTVPGGLFSSAYEEQTHSASRAAPACAAAI
jgi:hypothetical protein